MTYFNAVGNTGSTSSAHPACPWQRQAGYRYILLLFLLFIPKFIDLDLGPMNLCELYCLQVAVTFVSYVKIIFAADLQR